MAKPGPLLLPSTPNSITGRIDDRWICWYDPAHPALYSLRNTACFEETIACKQAALARSCSSRKEYAAAAQPPPEYKQQRNYMRAWQQLFLLLTQ